jgi:hypothetical protein
MVPDIYLKVPYPILGGLKLNGKLASGIQRLLFSPAISAARPSMPKMVFPALSSRSAPSGTGVAPVVPKGTTVWPDFCLRQPTCEKGRNGALAMTLSRVVAAWDGPAMVQHDTGTAASGGGSIRRRRRALSRNGPGATYLRALAASIRKAPNACEASGASAERDLNSLSGRNVTPTVALALSRPISPTIGGAWPRASSAPQPIRSGAT